jgi:hypothetical protein
VTDANSLLPSEIKEGARFTASYSLDPDTAGSCTTPETPFCLYVPDPLASWAAQLTVGGTVFTNAEEILVLVDNGHGAIVHRWELHYTVNEDPNLRIMLELLDTTRTRLSGEEFFVNQSLDGWTIARLSILTAQNWRPLATGTIVPEPTTAALLLPVIVAFVVCVRVRPSRADL